MAEAFAQPSHFTVHLDDHIHHHHQSTHTLPSTIRTQTLKHTIPQPHRPAHPCRTHPSHQHSHTRLHLPPKPDSLTPSPQKTTCDWPPGNPTEPRGPRTSKQQVHKENKTHRMTALPSPSPDVEVSGVRVTRTVPYRGHHGKNNHHGGR